MVCPRCKRETEGNYCSHCGFRLRPGREDRMFDGGRTDRLPGKNSLSPMAEKQQEPFRPERGRVTGAAAESEHSDMPPFTEGTEGARPAERITGRSRRRPQPRPADRRDRLEWPAGNSGTTGRGAGEGEDGKKPSKGGDGKKRRSDSRTGRRKFPKIPKLPGFLRLRLPDGIIKLCSRAAQIFCAFLMIRIAWLPAAGLWEGRAGLGSVHALAAERNYSLACYLALAGGYLLFTGVSALWILTRRHFAGEDRVISADMGRGLTAFLLLALAFWALPEAEAVLAGQSLLPGSQRFLEIMAAQSGEIFRAAALGALLSLGRRLLKR